MFIYQLTRPFAYLAIRPLKLKRSVDLIWPAVFALTLSFLCVCFRTKINVWGEEGLVLLLNSTVQILPGFYIAALAAIIALGNNKRLDENIVGTSSPTIKIRTIEYYEPVDKILTRRHFLCLLFSYLTAISLMLCIVTPILTAFAPILREYLLNSFLLSFIYFIFTFLFFFFIAQIVLITLLGLYYISDKMFS